LLSGVLVIVKPATATAWLTQRMVADVVEADSLNSAMLCADATPETPVFELFIKDVVREMTVRSGEKCTAIRRAFVPQASLDATLDTLKAKLAKITFGNPRNDGVPCVARALRERMEVVS
jgi:3,4-dehydroadipyl-CoA semialdehyde dehydrogenase